MHHRVDETRIEGASSRGQSERRAATRHAAPREDVPFPVGSELSRLILEKKGLLNGTTVGRFVVLPAIILILIILRAEAGGL